MTRQLERYGSGVCSVWAEIAFGLYLAELGIGERYQEAKGAAGWMRAFLSVAAERYRVGAIGGWLGSRIP